MKKDNKLSSFFGLAALVLAVAGLGVWMNDCQDKIFSETTTAYAQRINQASLAVDTGSDQQLYSAEFTRGDSAFDFLQQLAQSEGFEIGYEIYDFGTMIQAIDGVASDPAAGSYWMFYVNDQMATVGADGYELRPGDRVEFRYGGF